MISRFFKLPEGETDFEVTGEPEIRRNDRFDKNRLHIPTEIGTIAIDVRASLARAVLREMANGSVKGRKIGVIRKGTGLDTRYYPSNPNGKWFQ